MKFFIVCVLAVCIVAALAQTDDDKCSTANYCKDKVDKKLCIVWPGKADRYCRACDPTLANKDCQCPLGQFCVTNSEVPEYGTCMPKDASLYGKPCDHRITGLASLKKGENDLMFCGGVVYNSTGSAKYLEWTGECVRGVCTACSSAGTQGTPGSVCSDGRTCIKNGEVYAPAGLASYALFGENVNSFWNFFWFWSVVPIACIAFFMACKNGKLGPVRGQPQTPATATPSYKGEAA
jgi:hypothetical protein